jgi:rhamnogalacturonyl hydrolase YesR
MAALLPLQNRDGLWRNVVNHPGTYAEFSGTAMIGFAIRRGLENGWIQGREYARAVDRAWLAVNSSLVVVGHVHRRLRVDGAHGVGR